MQELMWGMCVLYGVTWYIMHVEVTQIHVVIWFLPSIDYPRGDKKIMYAIAHIVSI
jgi:hypothetical protein